MTRARDLGDFIADGGISQLDVTGNATITVADNSTALNIVSTDADENTGPRVDLTRNSASPAANDYLGQIRFMGEDSADNSLSYVSMFGQLLDPTDGGEDGSFELDVRLAGTNRSRIISNATETVFNDDSVDLDFRVESDTNTHALFVEGEGSNNRLKLGMGTGTITNPYSQNNFTDLNLDGTWGGMISFKLGGTEKGFIGQRNSGNEGMVLGASSGQELLFLTNGNNERFRIGTSGQLGIGGATYGTSGQVLTSGGSGAAPSWADASGGGSTDFVATGSITAGNVVGLTSSGTVKVVPALLGDPNQFESASRNEIFGVYEPNSGSVLVTYQGTSNYGYCKVGTISGNTISFGSEIQFSGNHTANIHDVFLDTTNNNVIIMYQDESNSDVGYIISGTLSGQSVTFGSLLNWTGVTSNPGIYYMGGAWDASAQRIVAVYWQNSDSAKAKVAVISTGGTGNRTLTTQGTPAQIGSQTSPSAISVTYDSTAQKTIAMFVSGASNKRVFVAMTVGSTSVTQGTVDASDDSLGTGIGSFTSAFIPTTNKVAYVYKQSSGGNKMVVGLISLSGTTITKNETTLAESYASIGQYTDFNMIGTSNGKFMIFYQDNDQNAPDKYRCTYGKFSGTTAVFEKKDFFFLNDANQDSGNAIGHVSYASGLGKFLLAHNNNRTDVSEALLGVADDMEVFENTIGLATQSVSDGATVTVTIVGGINENQSGLTVGRKYFLGKDGTLTNTQPEGFFPSDRVVGIATASTKLLITNSATTISMDGESALIGET